MPCRTRQAMDVAALPGLLPYAAATAPLTLPLQPAVAGLEAVPLLGDAGDGFEALPGEASATSAAPAPVVRLGLLWCA